MGATQEISGGACPDAQGTMIIGDKTPQCRGQGANPQKPQAVQGEGNGGHLTGCADRERCGNPAKLPSVAPRNYAEALERLVDSGRHAFLGLFASAKCPHAHIWGPFCQCKMSPCPYMGAFVPVQSVPMPIYGGLFARAQCPHAHIWGPFCESTVSPYPYMGPQSNPGLHVAERLVVEPQWDLRWRLPSIYQVGAAMSSTLLWVDAHRNVVYLLDSKE